MLLYTVARCFLSKRLKAAIKFFSSYFTNRWSWCKRGMVLLNEGKTCLLLNWKAYQFLHNFSAQQRVNTSSCFPFPNAFFSSEWNRFSMIKNNEIFILLLFPQHFLNSSIVVKSSKRMISKTAQFNYWILNRTGSNLRISFALPCCLLHHYPCFSILTYQRNLTREGRCARPNMKAAARWKKVEGWERKWPIRQNSKGIRLCSNNAFHSVGTVAIWIRVKPRNSASIVLQLWWWQITRG